MALVLLLVVGVILTAPRMSGRFKAANSGFASDWHCVNPSGDEPICVRQPPPKPSNSP